MARDLLISAAVATLVGGLAALLTAPKSGERIRKDLSDLYEDLSEKGGCIADQISKKKKNISRLLNDKSEWPSKAKAIFNELSTLESQEEEFCLKEILVGTAIGGVLGAAAGILLAPKSGNELRRNLAEAYDDLSGKAEEFIDNAQEKGEEYLDGAQNKINDVIEWATLGYKVWQGIKKRR